MAIAATHIRWDKIGDLENDLKENAALGGAHKQVEKGSDQNGDSPFANLLENGLKEVNQQMQQAKEASTHLAVGKTDNIHETMLSVTKAELSFEMLVQVRNKMLDSYKEVMNMQV